MANQIKCAFCGTSADTRARTGDALTFTCSRCGDYTIVGTAVEARAFGSLRDRN